jgi:hypothetical protein
MAGFFAELKPVTFIDSVRELTNQAKKRAQSALDRAIEIERQIQDKVIVRATNVPAIANKVLDTERKIQDILAGPQEAPPPPPSQVVLFPVQISGFFLATSQNVITFYVTTSWPTLPTGADVPLGPGWRATGVTGLVGNIVVTKTEKKAGVQQIGSLNSESYQWYFECQTDTEQNIQTVQGVIGAVLYPPDAGSLVTNTITAILSGFYYVSNGRLVYYIRGSTIPMSFGARWTVLNLKGLKSSNVVTENFVATSGKVKDIYQYDSYVTLRGDQVEDNTMEPVFGDVTVKQPIDQAKVIGANVRYTTDYSPEITATTINPNIKLTGGAPLRDLDTNVKSQVPFQDTYKELEKEGYNSGTTYSLYAVGPQDNYTSGKDDTLWNTSWPQHTNFVCYQRYIPIQGTKFLGDTITIELKPKELGDLMSNMYLTCQLPKLTNSSNIYVNQVGRALIAQCDFMINDTIVETVYDDWFFIKDQVFLDSDEQTAMFSAVNAGSVTSISPTTSNTTVIVPLEYFFCRRHSHMNKGRERLRRPYFPLCALYNQRIYIRIKFNPWPWISNDWNSAAADPTKTYKDIINPALIIEEIKLTDAEKLYYKTTKLRYIVNRLKKEGVQSFNSSTTQLQLTASFPVQMLIWFFRNKKYETVTSSLYTDVRYEYGFTTRYIQTSVSLPFTSGTTYFTDPIDTCKIVLNNMDITSTFQGSLYYAFKQPIEHNLSVPAKNIYMYSFGLNPKEYNAGGYVNFSKLDSQTTTLKLTFVQQYATQVSQGYNLYLFYYGYSILEFENGSARMPFA